MIKTLMILGLLLCSINVYADLNLELPTTHGIASFYKKGYRTSNGERYNRNAYTAASRYYPLGTLLEVRYPRKGTFVYVRVNDRGPYVKGRVIDLSARAARTLGITGLGEVDIRPVRLTSGSHFGNL